MSSTDLSRYHTPAPLQTLRVGFVAPWVLEVALSRPKIRNAIDDLFWSETRRVFEAVAEDGDVRVVLISGDGPLFCAGINLKERSTRSVPTEQGRKHFRHRRRVINEANGAFNAIEQCEKPTIAVSHGATFGAGIELLCATDIRYCTKDASYCLKETAIGIAADVGALQRLPRICGSDSFVRELAFSARHFSSSEALQWGFVNRVFDTKDQAMAAALDMAKEIAAQSPIAVTATKDILHFSRDSSVAAGIQYTANYVAGIAGGEDGQRVNAAMAAKKTPVFSKL
ncbi:peroxisomal enoyl CoA hydratase 1 [Hyaloraphidium curvatum]|nr:peroxisomal enoyl CoA hydratase 1 [Hyaloraphidium curvatum]